MTTSVIAPTVPGYADRVAYVTSAEFLHSATGVDTSQLVPGGDQAAQSAALDRILGRASAWADSICHQVLAATADTQAGRYRVRDGRVLRVPLNYTPIVYVTDVRMGALPSSIASIGALTDVWPNGKTITVPVSTGVPDGDNTRLYVEVDYVNGYANTAITDAADAGGQTLTVDNPVGIVPGLHMRIDDGTNPAHVVVADTYTIGDADVPLTGTLADAYAAGAVLSCLPEGIKQAVVSLACVLIKQRSVGAIVMDSMTGQPRTVSPSKTDGRGDDLATAKAMLCDHIRVW